MKNNHALYLWAAVMGFFITIAIVSFIGALAYAQTSGERPTFTCDPGGVYTTKECP